MSASFRLNLYLLTFNCGRTLIKPEAFGTHFFDALPDTVSQRQPPDLIVLHLQEIAPLAAGFQGHKLPQYYDRFKTAVQLAVNQRFPGIPSYDGSGGKGDGVYVDYTTGNAGLTAIMLFVRADLQSNIQDLMSAGVGVGVQKMGNKGAIGLRVAWKVAGSSDGGNASGGDNMNLTFVAAHLAPMEEELERRNQDFHDIVAGLVFESKTSKAPRQSTAGSQGEQQPLLSDTSTNDTDLIGMYAPDAHVFFAGDLNYRTSSTRPVHDGSDQEAFPQPVSSSSNPKHYSHLLARDQLTEQLRAGKTLHGLVEAPIAFPPTYKYSPAACGDKDIMLDSDVSEWKWSTHRWPSWCDRILYSAPSSPSTNITVGKYTSLPLLATSDHRPVALSVSVPLRAVVNHEFASRRPADLDPNWKANRDAARFKEVVVGSVWYTVSTTDGLLNLSMGLAAVVCFAVLATVYAREW